MSGLFVDNDGRWSWKKAGYRARSAFAVLVSLAILLGGGWIVYDKLDQVYMSFKYASDYPGPGGASVTVTIPSGATVTQIGQVLVNAGVIKSVGTFAKIATDKGDATKFQAGDFTLRAQIPAATAVEMLLDPANRVQRSVTVPEGERLSDTLSVISRKTGIPLADLQKEAKDLAALKLPTWAKNPNAPEGFLFPDTYNYDANPTAAEILPTMTAEFVSVANGLGLESKAKALGYTPLEVVTVASIVQVEVPPKYQAEVAAVIYNRLKQGMPLGLDTSVHYAVNKPMSQPLTSADFKSTSPYNTYTHTGLMPGPIDSPGKSALQAALNPASTNALYFVTVNLKTGETKFASTLAEHNRNVQEFDAWCQANPGTAGCPVP